MIYIMLFKGNINFIYEWSSPAFWFHSGRFLRTKLQDTHLLLPKTQNARLMKNFSTKYNFHIFRLFGDLMSRSSTANILHKKTPKRFEWINLHYKWKFCILALFLIDHISWVLLFSTWRGYLWYGHFNVIKFAATLFCCLGADGST